MNFMFDVYVGNTNRPLSEAHAYITLPATAFQLLDVRERLRIENPEDEYYQIEDYYDCDFLSSYLHGKASLTQLNTLAQKLSEMEEWRKDALEGLLKMDALKENRLPSMPGTLKTMWKRQRSIVLLLWRKGSRRWLLIFCTRNFWTTAILRREIWGSMPDWSCSPAAMSYGSVAQSYLPECGGRSSLPRLLAYPSGRWSRFPPWNRGWCSDSGKPVRWHRRVPSGSGTKRYYPGVGKRDRSFSHRSDQTPFSQHDSCGGYYEIGRCEAAARGYHLRGQPVSGSFCRRSKSRTCRGTLRSFHGAGADRKGDEK